MDEQEQPKPDRDRRRRQRQSEDQGFASGPDRPLRMEPTVDLPKEQPTVDRQDQAVDQTGIRQPERLVREVLQYSVDQLNQMIQDGRAEIDEKLALARQIHSEIVDSLNQALREDPEEMTVGLSSVFASDPKGNCYLVDGNRIIRITPEGIRSIFCGQDRAGYQGDGRMASQALLNGPSGVAFGPNESVMILDRSNGVIRRVDRHGVITTFCKI